MKRLVFILMSAFTVVPLFSQETYENANIATEDLNGTARYVGMGGAMDALGADICYKEIEPIEVNKNIV